MTSRPRAICGGCIGSVDARGRFVPDDARCIIPDWRVSAILALTSGIAFGVAGFIVILHLVA